MTIIIMLEMMMMMAMTMHDHIARKLIKEKKIAKFKKQIPKQT